VGHIQAGGVDEDVAFVREADDDINDQIADYVTGMEPTGGAIAAGTC
jgi:hypothetical protein